MRTHILEGRKREELVGELGNVARHKQGLTSWRGGRGRCGLVSLETWHITNEDSLTGEEEREERGGQVGNVVHHKKGLTCWRGGRGRSRVGRLETWHITNQGSLT